MPKKIEPKKYRTKANKAIRTQALNSLMEQYTQEGGVEAKWEEMREHLYQVTFPDYDEDNGDEEWDLRDSSDKNIRILDDKEEEFCKAMLELLLQVRPQWFNTTAPAKKP